MAIPILTGAPAVTPNKYGGDPVAFDTAMQAWIAWEAIRSSQDPAFLAWIEANAAAIAADRATVDAQAPSINAVNAVLGNVTTVAGIAAHVTTVAGAAAAVTAVAGIVANVTTVAAANAAVTAVAGITANVTTVAAANAAVGANATNIAAINTNADNIVAIQNAAANAATALAQANNAAASYDSFDDRYLGAKPAAPTLDNDGQALLTGALYWDTVLSSLRVYSGSAWSNTLVEVDDRILQDQLLLGGIEYATDMAGMAVKEAERITSELAAAKAIAIANAAVAAGATEATNATVVVNAATQGTAIEQAVNALAHLLDLVGVVARAISGGTVVLGGGTASAPALTNVDDLATGLMFPGAASVAMVTTGLERWRVDPNGYFGLGTNTPSGLLDVNDNRIRIRSAKTPATAVSAGNAGEVCWDASYMYVCVATNSWKRSNIAAW